MLSVYELRRRLFSDKLIVAGAGRIALGAKYMFDFSNDRYIGIKNESNADILMADVKREIDAKDVGDECRKIINNGTGYFIVVCSYHEEDVSRSLVHAGFNAYEDFISVFDLAKLLDFPDKFYEKANAAILIDDKGKQSAAFNFKKEYHTDFQLISYTELENNKYSRSPLLIISNRSKNIRNCLELGFKYNQDLFVMDNDDKRPSVFFKGIMETQPLDMLKCEHPFSFIE
ncbi:MAG: hypothetical protein IKN43_05720, partial [Selenomonadaceae bacterium]|nr:hypothetical protein [Selenomonadaceae bacterium]